MIQRPDTSLLSTLPRRFRWGAAFVLVVAFMVATGWLALDVRTKLDNLKRADSDNAIWVVSQSEVEFQRLRTALLAALSSTNANRTATLNEVRRRFDVVYSRASILTDSPIYAPVTRLERNAGHLGVLRAFLDRSIPVIDADDTTLQRGLPALLADSDQAQEALRALAVGSLMVLNEGAEERRESISSTLIRLGLAATGLVFTLSFLLVALRRQWRRTREQAAALRDSNARLDTIISTTGEGIIVTDAMGRTLELNPAAQAMFGHSIDAVRGRDAIRFLCPPGVAEDQRRIIMSALPQLGGPGTPALRLELDVQRANGEAFPIELSLAGTAADDAAAEDRIIVGFIRDISERKRHERELSEALKKAQAGEKAKVDFLAVMSHEMRTPLNGMVGAAELLAKTPLSDEQKVLVEVLGSSGRLLLGHVNAVLDITAAQAGSITLRPVAVDVDALIADCIANQEPNARNNGNVIRLNDLSGPIGAAMTDPARLGQILLNLLSNAVKFTRAGTVTIETELEGEGAARALHLRIADTGPGIPEESLQHVFEEFVTLETGYARQEGGTGLGLAVTRRLTEAMGGEIGVESEPGDGSLFWVRLPMVAAAADAKRDPGPALPATPAVASRASLAAPAPASPRTAPMSGQSLSILVIEDNDVTRFILRNHLLAEGHQVREAVDGIEGVEMAGAERFDVILTDISMPRLNGIEATRRIRAGAGGGASRAARIVAVTAHALTEELATFREAGMDDVLTKPVSGAALLAALAQPGSPVPPPPEMPDPEALLDPARLADLRRDLGEARLVPVLSQLLAEGEATVFYLKQALTTPAGHRDWDEVARQAHKLCGSAGTFGAMRLMRALAETELAVKSGAPSTERIEDVLQVWPATADAIRAALNQSVALPEQQA